MRAKAKYVLVGGLTAVSLTVSVYAWRPSFAVALENQGMTQSSVQGPIASSIPDDAYVISDDIAQLSDGTFVDIATGEETTNTDYLGSEDAPADPLDKTDGKKFIPQTAGDLRTSSSTDNMATLSARVSEGNSYGAYWGTYNGGPAFFMKDGTLFAENAASVIDVSEHNGTIDWDTVKAYGVDGAIIRIGFGTQRADYQAQRNINECKRLGIPFGVYLYSYAYDAAFATSEGNFVVSLLNSLGVAPSDLSYPVYYDLERWSWTGHTPPEDTGTYESIVRSWFQQVNGAGYDNASVYSYTSYLNGPLNTSYIHSKTSWVAQYGPRLAYSAFSTSLKGWQYSESGTVSGISGSADLSAFGGVAAGWAERQVDGRWYYVNLATGERAKGLTTLPDGREVYYDPETGAMAHGMQTVDGREVYLDVHDGHLARSEWYEWEGRRYRAGADGSRLTGELSDGGAWYYLDPAAGGAMATGFAELVDGDGLDKTSYYDPETGAMAHGERLLDSGWYHFDEVTGAMSRGLTTLPDGREVYYDPETGAMAHGMQTVDGREVYLDVHDGHLARSEWVPDGDGERWAGQSGELSSLWSSLANDGGRILLDADGKPLSGWQEVEGARFYALDGGSAAIGQILIDGSWYHFDESTGVMSRGFTFVTDENAPEGKWVYYDPETGAMRYGELLADGKWVYLDDATGAVCYGWKNLPDGVSITPGQTAPCNLAGLMLMGCGFTSTNTMAINCGRRTTPMVFGRECTGIRVLLPIW